MSGGKFNKAEYDKAYRARTKEKRKAQQAAYVKKHEAKIKAYRVAYRAKNKDKKQAYNNAYRSKNKAALLAKAAEYRTKNRKKINAYLKEYRRTHKRTDRKPFRLMSSEQKAKVLAYNLKRYHKKLKHDPAWKARHRQKAIEYIKRKKATDPLWQENKNKRVYKWRQENHPERYDSERISQARYREKNKGNEKRRRNEWLKPEETRKYKREYARKRRATPQEVLEAAAALRKLNRAILERLMNEKQNG